MANWIWMPEMGPTGQWYDGATNTWGGTDGNVDPNAAAPKNWWDGAGTGTLGAPQGYGLNPTTGKYEQMVKATIPPNPNGPNEASRLWPSEEYMPLSVAQAKGYNWAPIDPKIFENPKNDFDIGGALLQAFAAAMVGGGLTGTLPGIGGSGALTQLPGGQAGFDLLAGTEAAAAPQGALAQLAGGSSYGGATTLLDAPVSAALDMTGFKTPSAPLDFGPAAVDTSAYSWPQPNLLDQAITSGSGTIAGVGGTVGIPGGSMVDLANSANFIPATGAELGVPALPTTPRGSPPINPPVNPSLDPVTGEVITPSTTGGSTPPVDPVTGEVITPPTTGETVPPPPPVDPKLDPVTGEVITDPTTGGTTPTPPNPLDDVWKRILAGTATMEDWLGVLGKAAPGLIGAFGADQQNKTLADLAKRFEDYGAPSRARYEASFAPGFNLANVDGAYKGALDQTSESLLRRLSAQNGNPFGNPGGLIEANKQIVNGTALPALNTYRNQNANTGGLGALAGAYPGMAAGAAGSNSNVWNALGGAASDVLNPKPAPTSLADLYKLINSGSALA